jgi:sec-independent protein translocase protein TatA
MDSFSIWHWLIVGAVVLLVFGGRGKISEVMGDVAKGIKAFKTGMADTGEAVPPASRVQTIDRQVSVGNNQPTQSENKS